MEKDFSIVPYRWAYIHQYFNSIAGDKAYISFRSPNASGYWYVDNVRIHPYRPSIDLNGKDYIKIEGIRFESVLRGFVLRNGADHNEINNCTFTDMNNERYYTSCLIFNGYNQADLSSTHNWIHHNTFHTNGFMARTSGDSCDDIGNAFRIGTSDAKFDGSSFNLIENNLLYHNAHDSIIISTKYNTLRNNVFYNDGWMTNHYTDNGCQDSDGDPSTFNNPASDYGNRNILFENPNQNAGFNLVEGNRIGYAGTPPDDDGAYGIENPTDNNIVRFNYFYGNGAGGYNLKQQNGNPDDNRIYNNTFYHNGRGEDIHTIYQKGIKYNCYLSNPVGNVIKNNILFDNAIANLGGTCSYEVMQTLNTYLNNFENDPGFNNPDMSDISSGTLPDLSVESPSPVIDKGTHLTLAEGSGTNSTNLVVDDASYFQDGTWGSDLAADRTFHADWIAIGAIENIVQISSIDYGTQTITLESPISWIDNDPIWLYKDSSGRRVLYGDAPDIGAHEYNSDEGITCTIRGDVDCSQAIDELDVQAAMNVFLGLETDQDVTSRSDLNADSKVDILDIQEIINLVLDLQ